MQSIEVHDDHDWDEALRRKLLATEHANERAAKDAAKVLERAAKRLLRRYTHEEGTPTPSPPGEPPALVTGNLRRSYRTRRKVSPSRYVAMTEVGPTAAYSRIQELGGVTGRGYRTRLPARPYHRPATGAVRRDVRRVFVSRWREGLAA